MADPLTSADITARNALIVSAISAVVSGASLGISTWNALWTRRPSSVTWDIDEHYAINLERDRQKFGYAFRQQVPNEGSRAILLRFTYHGRFSATITGFTYDFNFLPHSRATLDPRVLNDGETWEGLIFHNDISMNQITYVTVFAQSGQTFSSPMNLDFRERMKMHLAPEAPAPSNRKEPEQG